MVSTKGIEGGIYRHYKGKLYRLERLVRHSETLEELVLYTALYENSLGSFWVRPKEMFFEDVEIDSQRVPRFEYVGDEKGKHRV